MSTTDFMGRDGFIWFTGVVEDRDDPDKLGRVRVRAVGYNTEDKDDIPTADLPWAWVMNPTTVPSMGGMGETPPFLVEGSWVLGFFRDPPLFQEPIILGSLPGFNLELPDGSKGFNDPNGKYPKSAYLNESDVNRRARNSSVTKTNIESQISVPNDPYNSKYSNNHIYQTESGHYKEYDDTPNAERIKEFHKSGTFYEIHPSGDSVVNIIGKGYRVVASNDSIHIKGDANLVVDGNYNITCKNKTETITETHKVTANKADLVYTSGEITVNGITQTQHTHTDTAGLGQGCLLYTSPSPRDRTRSRMPSSA